jgi:polyhydroxyalkanoate synthase
MAWDQARMQAVRLLDSLGAAPDPAPSRLVWVGPGLRLLGYALPGAAGPPVLLVPAPIKRAYIWDLAPEASVVRACLRQGLHVYLIDWTPPDACEQDFGLAHYADHLLLACIEVIAAETGQPRIAVMGHSLGGTLAAIFAALHPNRVRSLTLLEAPMTFGPGTGILTQLVAASPPAPLWTSSTGPVPGALLSLGGLLASPITFLLEPWLDWLASLPDAHARQTHLRVRRWALDELPMARCLFVEVLEELYRHDRFMRGDLWIAGRHATPQQVEAPLLSVVNPRSRIVPASAVLPFHRAVRCAPGEVLWYQGETGVALQHVGVLIGRTAHQDIWPKILAWIGAVSASA